MGVSGQLSKLGGGSSESVSVTSTFPNGLRASAALWSLSLEVPMRIAESPVQMRTVPPSSQMAFAPRKSTRSARPIRSLSGGFQHSGLTCTSRGGPHPSPPGGGVHVPYMKLTMFILEKPRFSVNCVMYAKLRESKLSPSHQRGQSLKSPASWISREPRVFRGGPARPRRRGV